MDKSPQIEFLPIYYALHHDSSIEKHVTLLLVVSPKCLADSAQFDLKW